MFEEIMRYLAFGHRDNFVYDEASGRCIMRKTDYFDTCRFLCVCLVDYDEMKETGKVAGYLRGRQAVQWLYGEDVEPEEWY